jgi:hypothetical protein
MRRTNNVKTTLTVDIKYDGRKTDPESIASAMDRLLETALSTPDLLDEYGNPTVGEFFVAEETTPSCRPKIVLGISGGVLQDLFGSPAAIDVILVDYDVEGCDPADDRIVEISNGRGGTQLASVAEYPVLPLTDVAGTDTEKAIKAAGLGRHLILDEAIQTTTLWVIYNFDMRELATTTVYDSYQEAVEAAEELQNVLVVPLIFEEIILRGEEPKGPSDE